MHGHRNCVALKRHLSRGAFWDIEREGWHEVAKCTLVSCPPRARASMMYRKRQSALGGKGGEEKRLQEDER